MNRNFKKILLAASILAVLVSACQPQDVVDLGGAAGAEPPPGGQMEPRPTSTPEGNVGDADQTTDEESSRQGDQAAPDAEEEVSGMEPEDIPSEEERDAILDRVNPGGPSLSGSDEDVEGPEPGTETDIPPKSGTETDIPSVEGDTDLVYYPREDTTYPEALVQRARQDLAQRFNASLDGVEVVNVEAVTWPDASLGGVGGGNLQVLTPGFRIVLALAGTHYAYHTGLTDEDVLFYGVVAAPTP